jgi:beta-glucosidase
VARPQPSGTATPQVYLTLPAATGEPAGGWPASARSHCTPGLAERVSITIDPGSAADPLSYWSTASDSWATLPGQCQLQVGSSTQDLPLTAPVLVG